MQVPQFWEISFSFGLEAFAVEAACFSPEKHAPSPAFWPCSARYCCGRKPEFCYVFRRHSSKKRLHPFIEFRMALKRALFMKKAICFHKKDLFMKRKSFILFSNGPEKGLFLYLPVTFFPPPLPSSASLGSSLYLVPMELQKVREGRLLQWVPLFTVQLDTTFQDSHRGKSSSLSDEGDFSACSPN